MSCHDVMMSSTSGSQCLFHSAAPLLQIFHFHFSLYNIIPYYVFLVSTVAYFIGNQFDYFNDKLLICVGCVIKSVAVTTTEILKWAF